MPTPGVSDLGTCMLAGRIDRNGLATAVAVLPHSNRWPVSYEPGPPPALLRGAGCGRCTTELKLPHPLVALTLCERIDLGPMSSRETSVKRAGMPA